MPQPKSISHRRLALLLASSWCAATAMQAFAGKPVEPGESLPAQTAAITRSETVDLIAQASPASTGDIAEAGSVSADAPPPITPAPEPEEDVSESFTVNLVNRLVERGILTKEDSAQLIRLAEKDVAKAKARAAAQQEAAIQTAVAQAVAAAQQQQAAQFTPAPDLLPPGAESAVRIPYIPEPVKAQLREDIKQDVLAEARNEKWVTRDLVPDWLPRIRLFGDVRVRYEGDFFPGGNDNTGGFPNFNAINTGDPFDVTGFTFSSQYNVDQDRQRFRLRARIGLEADLAEGFSAGLRIATGENNSPVSTNQSLGLANQGQGGNFSKYAIWLDRAYLRYETGGTPERNLSISIGRFDNPFFSTDIIWDEDLGFDGAALQARYEVLPGVTPVLNLGAFVVFNTDFNFSTNRPDKFPSDDKYLYAGQLGTDWKIRKDLTLKIAAAYYHFDNIEGELSDPFVPLSPDDAGNTDNTRPSFAQKGNSYFPIRNITPSPLNNFGTTNQFQYFGLATPFHELALTARLDYSRWEPFQISLIGEFVKNLAFSHGDVERKAINNRGSQSAGSLVGPFEGGDTAWIVGLKVGHAALQKRWDWFAGVNYRYVESDAVVDGFNDSEFGGGGTNLKGFSLFGAVALSQRVAIGLRWMSASEIAGPQYQEDILQVDLNGKF